MLCFVATKNAGSTTPGDPYRARFLDDHDNLISWPVDWPELPSTSFQWLNEIEKHNQAQKLQLRLEKHWRTQNAWFHLIKAIIGIVVTEAWKGYRHAFKAEKVMKTWPSLTLQIIYLTTTLTMIEKAKLLAFYHHWKTAKDLPDFRKWTQAGAI
jgi:hypothetical protein